MVEKRTLTHQVEATAPPAIEDDGGVEDSAESSATFETTSSEGDASSKASSRKISDTMLNNNAEEISVVKERITRR